MVKAKRRRKRSRSLLGGVQRDVGGIVGLGIGVGVGSAVVAGVGAKAGVSVGGGLATVGGMMPIVGTTVMAKHTLKGMKQISKAYKKKKRRR